MALCDLEPPGAALRVASLRVAVIGLGNPLLSDDAAGLVVARGVHERLGHPAVDLIQLPAGGVELMETLWGYRKAVVIDAIVTPGGVAGSYYEVDLSHPTACRRAGSTHEIGILEGLALGRRLGLAVPESLRLYAVEVADPFTFGTRMTAAVEAAVPVIAAEIASAVRDELVAEGEPSFPTRTSGEEEQC